MYEIELKAWVLDTKKVKQKLDSFSEYQGFSTKKDFYWYNQEEEIRIRNQSFCDKNNSSPLNEIIVTYKKKELRGAVEVNDETEFTVSSKESFEKLLKGLGFKIKITKEKSTYNWIWKDYHIELATIEKVGDFLEIETLCEKNDEETSIFHTNKIKEIFTKCEIDQCEIEKRYYSYMIKNGINTQNRHL